MEQVKILLGEAANNYTDELITKYYNLAVAEVEEYCRRPLDATLTYAAEQIAKIKLLRLNTEGLASANFSGVGEVYINGYPEEIVKLLNSKRKIKVV